MYRHVILDRLSRFLMDAVSNLGHAIVNLTCGGGQKYRVRSIAVPAINGGSPCSGMMSMMDSCNMQTCENNDCVDCLWGEWTDWGACSHCGGQRYRVRSILRMNNDCGQRYR